MAKPELKRISERLAWARRVAGLSAYALSKRAELSLAHVGLIENGKRTNIDVETARRLAAALGISWIWLLCGDGKRPSESSIRSAVVVEKSGTEG